MSPTTYPQSPLEMSSIGWENNPLKSGLTPPPIKTKVKPEDSLEKLHLYGFLGMMMVMMIVVVCILVGAWYLYNMVAQNILLTY